MAARANLWLVLAVVLVLGVAASGCGAPAGDATAPALEVREPRAVLLPASGAVYFTVVNRGDRSDRLLRVETAAARQAETHESVVENDVMRMVPHPDGFEVPARGKLELKPGGKHVMLVEPRPADAGGKIRLTLRFERAGAVEVQAPVSAAGEGAEQP
jgi:copper(I)-binding protein